jgi:CRISPR-associated protein Cst2
MTTAIRSLSLSGRLTLDMHSLNNEGGEGNQIQTRMVHIVDGQGDLAVVNAISGDMLKHIQAEHLWTIATASEGKLPLCAGCTVFNANRVNVDRDFIGSLQNSKDNSDITSRLLRHCILDDTEGILITEGKRSMPRKSTIEFGWMVGMPEKTRTESYFHVKYDLAGRGAGAGDESGANTGQNIFYRPASSGVYAVVAHVELHRVGYNDVSRTYTLDDEQRRDRQRALVQSLLYTFLRTAGAHRNTQHPHVLNFEGVVAVSRAAAPAPTASALSSNYAEQMTQTAESLNRMVGEGAIAVNPFDSSAGFADQLANIVAAI